MIPFNKPYYSKSLTGKIEEVITSGKTSGGGSYTKKCQEWLETKYSLEKVLLTTSCTDALELSSLLMDIQPGDEVILPSYTFVSTANPFLLRGAKLVFADSASDSPNLDLDQLESLINEKTRAIVIVHYASICCDMDRLKLIAAHHGLFLVEDAAQCIDAYYKDQPLGSIGDIGAFSFHDTKNIVCGEGGCIMINNKKLIDRAEILWEKGTNRAAFFRGEVDKYGWIDVGSSFLASEFTAAILYSQFEEIDKIQVRRHELWNKYFKGLELLESLGVQLPNIPDDSSHNAHIFYLVCRDADERNDLISFLKTYNISSVFHYLSLHSSLYFEDKHDGRELPNADRYSGCLLRLPLYYELELKQVDFIIKAIRDFYENRHK
ncbi:MAG: dTDP-4-amino-4,6-dideoxygalactose transaminase [Bacteroidota bacterium]